MAGAIEYACRGCGSKQRSRELDVDTTRLCPACAEAEAALRLRAQGPADGLLPEAASLFSDLDLRPEHDG